MVHGPSRPRRHSRRSASRHAAPRGNGRARTFFSNQDYLLGARLVARAQDWRWSSTRAHLSGKADGITSLKPVSDLLEQEADAEAFARLRAAESIDRVSVTVHLISFGDGAFNLVSIDLN